MKYLVVADVEIPDDYPPVKLEQLVNTIKDVLAQNKIIVHDYQFGKLP